MIYRTTITATSSGAAGGTVTATTAAPVNGLVVEIRNNSASWGGTADYNFTRTDGEGGGTVLSLSNQAGPWSALVGGSVSGMGDGQAVRGIPCTGPLSMELIQATGAVAGTVHVYYEA